MAKTIKIPGVGAVKTQHAVIGALAVAGIAGFFWIRHLNAAPPPAEPASADFTETGDYVYGDPGDAFATDYAYDGGAYPYPSYTTPSYGLTTTVQTPDPTTNQEWTARSIEHLEMVGIDAQAASLAVSRYLLKECLTATQADIVRQAVGRLSTPPQGSFSIVVCPAPPPPGTDPPPAGGGGPLGTPTKLHVIKASQSFITVDWTEPTGNVAGYVLYQDGAVRYPTHPNYSLASWSGLTRNRSYRLGVAARAADGSVGPVATITAKTAK